MELQMYTLITDENGVEKRQTFRLKDRAMTEWERACGRNICFSAKLYDPAGKLIADHDSE